MRSCTSSTVAGREKPSVVEHQRLYPLTAVCFFEPGKTTLGCIDRRPIPNRPLDETNLLCPLLSAAVGPPQHTRWLKEYTGYLPLGGGRCKSAVYQPCHEQ